jgi:phospholipid/cholesterol/gamma-HCH transport system ATP-binding protein
LTTQTTAASPLGLSPQDEECVKLCATNLLEVVSALGVAMARHIHEQLPEMGTVDDAAAVEATRLSCVANMREMTVMLRAGLPATAHETPTDALEYVRFMRGRGVGLSSVLKAYQHGVSMFGAVVANEFERAADDASQFQRMFDAVNAFVFVYIDRVTERLGVEYGNGSGEHRAGPEDPVWANPKSIEAAEAFLAELAARPVSEEAAVSHARQEAERVLNRFRDAIERASRDERLTHRLAQADTTVRIELADEPDLALTLTLEEPQIAVASGEHPAEVEMSLASMDLERMWSGDFNLSMAIARGRVEVSGPVRKFLRVVPIIRQLSNGHAASTNGAGPSEPADPLDPEDLASRAAAGGAEESRFDAPTRGVLDQAADYQHHQGALGYSEEAPGHFWSIECRGVYKTFGTNRVLNGLDVGIPEGMITVVLGPSGTGKSVLISHLIGLMFPDQGHVLVHGQNVSKLRMSELLEMRRKFGILFQDGALFGSMNVYDNVAFPLRQHTDKSEAEIADIVNQRLAEVGLSGADSRLPGELSGGMRKRAGFARALVLDPEIVMFDEPDSGLDPVRTALLCELIEQMHAEHGGTYIVITHDIASARRIADYLVVLWKGRIVQSGDRDDMFTSSNPFVRQFLAGRPQGPLGME